MATCPSCRSVSVVPCCPPPPPTSPPLQSPLLVQGPPKGDQVVDITPGAALGFVFVASAVLLLLFFFLNKSFFYVLVSRGI